MKSSTKFKIALMIFVIGIYFISMASALTVQSFSVNPNEIAPGKTGEISVLLKNNGEEDLEDVVVNLELSNSPFAPYNSGTDFNIEEFDSEDDKRVGFRIIVLNDAKAGIYKIPLHVDYFEDNKTKKINSLVSVIVNSEPILDADIEDGLLLKGQQGQISVKIVNKGLADMKFLDAEIGNSNSYNVVSQKKVYIGDVDSDDFQTADFKLFFNANAPDSVKVPVKIVYKDITNKEYTQNFVLNARVYSQQDAVNLGLVAKSKTLYYVIIVIVIVLVYFVYRFIRNRRRKNEGF